MGKKNYLCTHFYNNNSQITIGRIGDIMKRIRKSKSRITIDDFVKAMKKANREAEQQILGPGFHAKDKAHRSKKIYTRKNKHKGKEINN